MPKMVGLWRETSGKIMVYHGLLVSDGGKNPNPRNWRKPLISEAYSWGQY